MTVIAYKDGVLAADTLVTWRAHRDGYVQKIFKRGPILFAASGSTAMAQRFTDWVGTGMAKDRQPEMLGSAPPGESAPVSTGFIFLPDGMITQLNHIGWERFRAPIFAAGSGCDYAYGAMVAGATAEEAVRAAIQYDTTCGGDVTVLRHYPASADGLAPQWSWPRSPGHSLW